MAHRSLTMVVLALMCTACAVSAAPVYNGGQNLGAQGSRYEAIPSSSVVAVHLAHVPGTDTYLYLARPQCGPITGAFDLGKRVNLPVTVGDAVFCAGQCPTSSGSVIVAGGHVMEDKRQLAKYPDGTKSIREYNPRQDKGRLRGVTKMPYGRWYPTLTLLPDSQIMIMGGTKKPNGADKDENLNYDVFNPAAPNGVRSWPMEAEYLRQYRQAYYPFNYVLPTGDVFSYCNRESRILIGQTGTWRKQGGKYVSAPTKPGPEGSSFPHTGTSVMAALKPPYNKVDVILFGGAALDDCKDIYRVASSKSWRISISWTQAGPTSAPVYSFGNWVEEEMGIPRVMGDSTLLPNGNIVLQNGAQGGCAGDMGPTSNGKAQPRSTRPAFWSQLYRTDAAQGRRFSITAASNVARMYHSTTALTTNGTILVAGCDRCQLIYTQAPFWEPATKNRMCEYRQQIFHPPGSAGSAPWITAVDGQESRQTIPEFGYGEQFDVEFRGAAVSEVSIVAPSATTHSFDMNQRVVFLPISGNGDGKVTLRTPPHPFIAPPQLYMIFLMNSDAYGAARWIKLVDRTGAGKRLPAA